jgi:hypothetical protein
LKSLISRVVLALVVMPAALPGHAAPVGAIVNGEFEIAVEAAKEPVCGVFGDTAINILPPEADPGIPDPTSPGDNLPWPWLVSVTPCEAGVLKAAQWSSSGVTQFGDLDGDEDREASIDGSRPVDPFIGSAHNMWQSYANPQQAFTANFDALQFRVEDGAIPPGAYVQISLSASPLETVSPYVGIFLDCFLTFTNLTPNGAGLVSVDPVDAQFASAYTDCDAAAAEWNASGAAGRREVLSRLRLVQTSFWGFETGAPVVLDGVDLVGSKTILGI